ncbi:extracellular solute-binding protein [Kiritimatiellaeota bacterium B1221]|nr:extracellular solute-binding protein [Kiritimatiellaeota bacterium B1221]
MAEKEGNSKYINMLGLSVLLVCYAGAIWNVVKSKRQEQRADVIRIVHWQLELGVRDGLQVLIDEFEAYKAEQGQAVEVVQIPIPERAYNQYVTTQLIGGTAPDMIQIGMFPEEYLGRYFYPLSNEIQKPNPFMNRRLEILSAKSELTPVEAEELEMVKILAGKPWMDSFTDGLRGQFKENFQEYFGVGFSTFTVRMYYNKDLFKKVLGHDNPPSKFEELINVSNAIKDYGKENGIDLLPIASSKYQADVFRNRYLAELTSDLSKEYDMDYSGSTVGEEKLYAMLRGDLTPWNEQYKASIELVQDLADFFPRGFMSMGREDSGFAFVQGKAGMITSGSWDALSYLKKIEDQPEAGRFEVGIFDLPSISKDHPKYGQFADGRNSEATSGTGFGFGITRFTRNFDLCVEFLQFSTTPDMNTKVNEIAGWIPVVKGAVPGELLKKFQPNFVGYQGSVNFEVMSGGKVRLLEQQVYWPLISGDSDFETYAKTLWEKLPAEASTDYKRIYQGSMESVPNRQARRSAYLANVVLGDQDPEKRTAREIQLQRSMQPLLKFLVTQKRMDRMMKVTLEQVPDDEMIQKFNRDFFKALDREMSQ